MTDLQRAVREYIDRQDRVSHPKGKTDNANRFYPSDDEWQECCANVRSPSRAWPWSYMLHCRTAVHVANLFAVDVKELRRRARPYRARL